jgi:RHS repeat-associated protein
MGSTGGSAVYVHLGDVLVAQDAWAWRSPFGMTFFHVDHQGTPIARSDSWGVVFERTRRGSFGLPLVGPLKNGPGYTGHMEDPGTGLVYMQQRYYDPAIARFLSVDPVGPLADPTNHFGRYHYGLNNPYRFTDPDGREPKHKPSPCTGTRIPTDGCGAFPGNQGASFGRNTGSGDPVADAEVADLRRARAPLAEGVQEAGQAASAIGDGIETIYLAAIPVPGAAIAGAARAAGIVGGKITGYTRHGLEQAIGRDGGRGVHPQAIVDAVRSPTKVIEQAGGKTKYVGKDATVILNNEGKVVTTWGLPRDPVPNQ